MAVRLSVLLVGCPLPPGRFLVLISVKRLSRPQGHSAAGRIRSIEKSNDLIGNPISDLPATNYDTARPLEDGSRTFFQNISQTTQCHILEDEILYTHRRENRMAHTEQRMFLPQRPCSPLSVHVPTLSLHASGPLRRALNQHSSSNQFRSSLQERQEKQKRIRSTH
jgi:hypothetical protein